jgi:FixJ family two-component response regulator
MPTAEIHIAVIDDETGIRKALSRLLRSAGYQITTFGSATEFLASISNSSHFHCLLLDMQMPGLSGLELHTQLVRSALNIPIIYLTGHADIPTSIKAMQLGASDFLMKPTDEHVLLGAIDQAIGQDRRAKSAIQ